MSTFATNILFHCGLSSKQWLSAECMAWIKAYWYATVCKARTITKCFLWTSARVLPRDYQNTCQIMSTKPSRCTAPPITCLGEESIKMPPMMLSNYLKPVKRYIKLSLSIKVHASSVWFTACFHRLCYSWLSSEAREVEYPSKLSCYRHWPIHAQKLEWFSLFT